MTPWPMIEAALAQGAISYADAAFAEMLLRNHPEATEATAGFICHLTLAAREGHLCVHLENGHLQPAPQALWPVSEPLGPFLNSFATGALQVPVLAVDASTIYPDAPICRFNNSFYLQKNWIYETLFLNHLQRLLQSKPVLEIPHEKAAAAVAALVQEGKVNALQAAAIQNALQSNFHVISGGPGTGKTYTAGCLITLFHTLVQTGIKIAIAAPTGKAASNLQASLPTLPGCTLHSSTLHALLGLKKDQRDAKPSVLPYDLLIVDESSMIDVKLMALLFASIKPGGRLILLGDPYQLPPVEAGSLFSDILQRLDACRFTALKTCLRVELQELVNFAEGIKQGVLKQEGVRRIPLEPAALLEQDEAFLTDAQDPVEVLETFKSFRILSPLRKGPYGVDEVNALIYRRCLQKNPRGRPLAVPIIITKNDYKRELFNGDAGVLVRGNEEYALFPDKTGFRKIPLLLLPDYALAYCLSVHKSQGSEFHKVLLLLPEGSECFGREVLYTAATRARKELWIAGSDEVIQQTLIKQSERISGILGRM